LPPSVAEPPSESLLDVVDSLIDKGVALDGEIVLGLADVDLIYVRLGALVAAADKVLGPGSGARPRRRRSRRVRSTAEPVPGPASARAMPAPLRSAPGTPLPGRALAEVDSKPLAEVSDANRSVIRLVLTLVDFVRGLLERQALRRVEEGTLSADETERLGRALMLLEDTIREMADRHGIDPASLNLDLGPLGRLR